MPENGIGPASTDAALAEVCAEINAIPGLKDRVTDLVRKAIDDVLRGDRTKRYSIDQLTRDEKTHIGSAVELRLKEELFAQRCGGVLDTTVAGHEVDIKNTIGTSWMIPPEAVDQICLLVRIDEENGTFSFGAIRANRELLTKPNRDKKHGLSTKGREQVCWFIHEAPFSRSIFLTGDPGLREAIFEKTSGQARVAELFRRVVGIPIDRSDLELVAAGKDRQIDLRARVRDAKMKLTPEGLLVLRGFNHAERKQALAMGYPITRRQCISIRQVVDDGQALETRS